MPNNADSAPSASGFSGRDAPDASVDPSPISNLHVKSLADLAHMAEQLPVNWEALPRVPFFGGLMGYTDEWYRAAVGMGVLETRWRGQRELTPDEVQVVAGQTAKAVVIMSWELPALVATTYFLERQGRATFRFPFYQPTSPAFSPDSFPMQGRYTLLRGPAARVSWHMLRASLYGSLSHWGLRMLFASYALSVKTAEFEREPRLADLRDSVKQAMAARASARRRGSEGGPPGQLPPWGRPQPAQGSSGAAPGALRASTAGAYAGDADPTAFQQQEAQQHKNPYPPQPPPPPPPAQQPWSQQPQEAADTAYDMDGLDDEGYHDDDASPVAASAARRKRWQRAAATSSAHGNAADGSDGSDGSSYGGGGGSAWDRVREQAAHGTLPPARHYAGGWRRGDDAQPKAAPEAPATPATDRDYVYDAAAEEKTYVREQAQKEFDAMMERERRGESDTRPTRR